MPITQGLTLITSLAGGEQELGQRLLADVLDGNGRVRFMSIVSFHDYICRRYGFALRRNTSEFVRPGGRHLFYVHGNLLLRVKTSGTNIRPQPHMTLSAATGLGWNDEAAKFNAAGAVVPKLGSSRAGNDWRTLARIGDTATILASDDRWANLCHFDFVRGFTDSGAANLRAVGR